MLPFQLYLLPSPLMFLTHCYCCSVAKSYLWPYRLQHARLLSPPPSPGVYSNSCPVSQWYYLNIILCLPLLLPSIFPSIRVFSKASALCIRWPKYWSFLGIWTYLPLKWKQYWTLLTHLCLILRIFQITFILMNS